MKRILVCSDIHGNRNSITLLFDRIEKEEADALLCAGDIGLDRLQKERELFHSLAIPLYLVRGNCDLSYSFSEAGFQLAPRYQIIEMGVRKIFLTHGDRIYNYQASPIRLSPSDIFVSGHTHIAHLRKESHTPYLLNPGSLAYPRDNREASYALITENLIEIKGLESLTLIDSLELHETSYGEPN